MDSPKQTSHEEILRDASERAARVLETVTRDAESLRASRDPAHAEGAALCDDVAKATRHLLAELERRRETPTP